MGEAEVSGEVASIDGRTKTENCSKSLWLVDAPLAELAEKSKPTYWLGKRKTASIAGRLKKLPSLAMAVKARFRGAPANLRGRVVAGPVVWDWFSTTTFHSA